MLAESKLIGSAICVLVTVAYACCAAAVAVLPLPARSVNLSAATLTSMVPVELAVGVTTRVACVPSTRVKLPLVPPVTTTEAVVKLVPTSSLKVNANVTSPAAVAAAMLSVIVTVGGVVSGAGATGGGAGAGALVGGASASPPPQALSIISAARAQADRGRCLMERLMAKRPEWG